jgi:hypothetical protein
MTYKESNYQSTRVSLRGGLRRNFAMNQNTVAYAREKHIGPVASMVLISLIVVGLLVLYLMQLAATGSYGYQLNDISKEQDALVAEQQDLEVDNARMQSLTAVRGSTVASAMVEPATTDAAN